MKNLKSGFTFIEMLVVIAIIGILTGIIMTNISPTRAKARDGKRISDISNLQLALEQYFDRCNSYPSALDSTDQAECVASPSSGIVLSKYITTLPTPPSATAGTLYDYYRISNTDYGLHVLLETNSEILNDGMDSISGSSFDCSKSNKNYCVGPR